MGDWFRRARRRVLTWFAAAERPAAWIILAAAVVTFAGVVTNLIATGNARLATLLVAAELMVSGFSAVQETEDDEG